jgi:hypothetical protein
MCSGAFRNDVTMNNPTVEYFPPKLLTNSGKTQIYLPFLERTLFSNLFPIVITLPTPGLVFLVANRDAIVYNYKTNREFRLPRLPNGVRVTYPMTGGGIILPLSPQNGYKPEVLICGGSDLDDSLPTRFIKASYPATTQCARMVITKLGIRKGWQVEHMPQGRIMPDLIMMPDGKVLIVNGARTVSSHHLLFVFFLTCRPFSPHRAGLRPEHPSDLYYSCSLSSGGGRLRKSPKDDGKFECREPQLHAGVIRPGRASGPQVQLGGTSDHQYRQALPFGCDANA